MAKGIQCHSNHSLQLFELENKRNKNSNISSSYNPQYFHTTEHAYTDLPSWFV